MTLPTLFVPHGGGPCFFMDPDGGPPDPMWRPMQSYLAGLIDSLPERPRAILLVSGHWEEDAVTLHTGERPDLLFDYYGFPEHTYRLRWDAPGAPDVARRAADLLDAAGFAPREESARGWDHGVFVPMKVAVPHADIPLVQIVANPLITLLGKPATASSRLTFAQAFNSLGTTIFPIVGAAIILGSLAKVQAKDLSGPALDSYRTAESQAIVHGYIGLAIALAIVAAVVWAFRNRLKGEAHTAGTGLAGLDLLARPRFAFGALCIFLYVGAEVSIGSLIVNYLKQSNVMGLTTEAAGGLIFVYWGCAMIGRFIGSAVLRVVSPGKVLAAVAIGAIGAIAISTHTTGKVSGYSLLLIGLMNSIMFPTIFTLACDKLGARAADGSGIINVAIFGGAVLPLATGALADTTGSLALALLLPAACYAIIALFGLYARRPAEDYADA